MNRRERIRTAILVMAWFHASIQMRTEIGGISIIAALMVTFTYVLIDVSDLRVGTLPTRTIIAKAKQVDDVSRRVEAQRRSWQPNEPS